MNIIRFIAEIFILYFLYRLVFDFIIPVYQASKKVKQQFGEMQSKMQDQMHKFDAQQSRKTQPTSTREPQKKKEEYIDYEEIKD